MSARHPSRRTLVTIGVVLALVLGVMAADWFARQAVQHRITAALEPTLGTSPTVTVGGWSALVGLATDRWPSVEVSTPSARAQADGKELPVGLRLTARSVDGLVRSDTITAGRLDGTVAIGWPAMTQLTGAELSARPDGIVEARSTITVLGERLPVTVAGRPGIHLEAQRLELDDPHATLDGVEVPDAVVDGMLSRMQARLELPRVPGLRFVTIRAAAGGAELGVEGSAISVHKP